MNFEICNCTCKYNGGKVSSEVLLTPALQAPTATFQYSEDGHGLDAPDSSAHGLGLGGGWGWYLLLLCLTRLVGTCGSCGGYLWRLRASPDCLQGGSGPGGQF